MTPTRYELLIEKGCIYLRGFSSECKKGFFNAEAVPYKTGESLPALRIRGTKQAKRFNVPFVDKTA